MAEAEVVECRSYTHARRHPGVIGKIGGWTLPSPVSPTQLGVLVGSFVVLVQTRGLWGHLPPMFNLVVLAGLPIGLGWSVRHLRMEGRSPLRMAAGVAVLASRPPGGTRLGRPVRARRPTGCRTRVLVEPGPAPARRRTGR
ncbi:MAG: TcpE family conjugal transfer membrane protein [Acidimicrobiia bacterium]